MSYDVLFIYGDGTEEYTEIGTGGAGATTHARNSASCTDTVPARVEGEIAPQDYARCSSVRTDESRGGLHRE